MHETAHGPVFRLIGRRLCLDFINTMHNYGGSPPRDELVSYAVLVAWSQQAGIATDREAQGLLREAARLPLDADNALKRAKGLRDVLYRIFSAVAPERAPEPEDLALVTRGSRGRAWAPADRLHSPGIRMELDWNRRNSRMDALATSTVRGGAAGLG